MNEFKMFIFLLNYILEYLFLIMNSKVLKSQKETTFSDDDDR